MRAFEIDFQNNFTYLVFIIIYLGKTNIKKKKKKNYKMGRGFWRKKKKDILSKYKKVKKI